MFLLCVFMQMSLLGSFADTYTNDRDQHYTITSTHSLPLMIVNSCDIVGQLFYIRFIVGLIPK